MARGRRIGKFVFPSWPINRGEYVAKQVGHLDDLEAYRSVTIAAPDNGCTGLLQMQGTFVNKVSECQIFHITVFSVDVKGTTHAQRNATIAVETAPPNPSPQRPVEREVFSSNRISMQAKTLAETDGHADPVPAIHPIMRVA